jgi:hypothetical protein
MEKTPEEALAYEIATALNDLKSIDWHIACARRYSERMLREKLDYVLKKKDVDNPAGYYTYLVKLYGQRPRD